MVSLRGGGGTECFQAGSRGVQSPPASLSLGGQCHLLVLKIKIIFKTKWFWFLSTRSKDRCYF